MASPSQRAGWVLLFLDPHWDCHYSLGGRTEWLKHVSTETADFIDRLDRLDGPMLCVLLLKPIREAEM